MAFQFGEHLEYVPHQVQYVSISDIVVNVNVNNGQVMINRLSICDKVEEGIGHIVLGDRIKSIHC